MNPIRNKPATTLAPLFSLYFFTFYFLLLPFSFSSEPPIWSEGRIISPSITYRFFIEQRRGFHQQIHQVRVNLLGRNVSMDIMPVKGFPQSLELPSEIMKRKKALVVVPASLFRRAKNGRFFPLGNLRFSDETYTAGGDFSGVEICPLNRIVFCADDSEKKTHPGRLIFEKGVSIELAGVNVPPDGDGIYLYTKLFGTITKKEMVRWGVGHCYLLEMVAYSSDVSLYWVRKAYKGQRTLHPPEKNRIVLVVGHKAERFAGEFLYRRHVRVELPEEKPDMLLRGAFCGGPYFLHGGKYDADAVRRFCTQPGAPPLSHYSTPQARLALALDSSRQILSIFAVDKRGFSREGMTLAEFARFIANAGAVEAIALPDGKYASLILPDGRANETPTGIEEPVLTALCISERAPAPGEVLNLLRRYPSFIRACGSEPNNAVQAIKDGSYAPLPSLNNYWEHISEDTFHTHVILIDLYRPCEVTALEFFYAGEVGFSTQFNWRAFTLYIREIDGTSWRKLLHITNPTGLSCQRITMPPGTNFRLLRIEIDEPTAFKENHTVRLAELAILGNLPKK